VTSEVSVSVEDGVVRVTSIGRASELASTAIERARTEAKARNLQRVLFDIRQLDMDDGFMHIMNYGELARRLGFDASYRFAVLNSRFDDKMRFIEITAVAYQLRARIFTDQAAALDWLKQ
jgi:hypothetical protein